MAIFNNSIIPAGAAAAPDVVTKSLRFDRASTSKLTRTFGTPTSQKKVTISWWMKLAEQGNGSTGYCGLFVSGTHYSDYSGISLGGGTSNQINSSSVTGGGYNEGWQLGRSFRDMGAWMHVCYVVDTTLSTAADRTKFYINGVRDSTNVSSVATNWPLNHDTDWSESGKELGIGLDNGTAGPYFGGYLADIHYIDGQALTPTAFAEEDATTGQWKPKAFVGVYGNNGFHLEFKETGTGTASSTTIGADTSVDTYIVATGGDGTETDGSEIDGDYKYHVFNSTGTFEVTTGNDSGVEYLVIAGGGGGGHGTTTNRWREGAGGGAGGYLTAAGASTASGTAYTVTVGAGGSSSTLQHVQGGDGNDSVFSSYTADGGGGGGSSANEAGRAGGSGGGAVYDSAVGSATAGQGNNGGIGGNNVQHSGGWRWRWQRLSWWYASGSTGGNGGSGSSSSITGSAVTRAGGGGGSGGSLGSGGSGGGGDAGSPAGTGGSTNTGGGGGASMAGNSGAGGSGVVIIRYKFQ